VPKKFKMSKKENTFAALLQSYIYCTRGGQEDDDYDIRDEEDFGDFMKQFRELYPK
jgi:hypothetical protein